MDSVDLNDNDFAQDRIIHDLSSSDVPETHLLLNKLNNPASRFTSDRPISIASETTDDFDVEEPSSFNYITEDIFSNVFDKLSTRFYNKIPKRFNSSYEVDSFGSDDDFIQPTRRFDELKIPTLALRPRSIFRPLRSMISPLESFSVFPEFDQLATTKDNLFQSHTQNFADNSDSYIVKTEFPGYNKGDISVNVNGNYLEISAATGASAVDSNSRSQSASSFYSSFAIPQNVDANSITAKFKDGVLTVKMPNVGNFSGASHPVGWYAVVLGLMGWASYKILFLFIFILHKFVVSKCYEFDASDVLILDRGSRYHLCNIPTAASYLGQVMSPSYLFGLSEGGKIEIDVSIDSFKPINDEIPSRFADNNSEVENTEDVVLYKYDKSGNLVDVKKINRPILHSSHSNSTLPNKILSATRWWVWFSFWSEDNLYPGKERTAEPIPNTYLMVMDYYQWTNFLNSKTEDLIQPANNELGFVYHPHLTSILKVPICNINEKVKRLINIDKLDRYVVFIYNPERHLLKLSGTVKYYNHPNTNQALIGQSHDLFYVDNVVLVFALFNLIAAIIYSILLYKFGNSFKLINHLIIINFILCSVYMLMDYFRFKWVVNTNYNASIVYYISNVLMKIQEVFYLFILIALALGWQILRQSLTRLEHQIIIFLCIASLYLGILEVLITNTVLSRFILHAIVYVIILMAINFNWAIIYSRIGEEHIGPEAAKLYHQLKSYHKYRLVFAFFLLKPAIVTAFKHIALRPVFSQMFVWDQHIFLFVNLGCNLLLNIIVAQIFFPRLPKGLLTQIPNGNHQNN